MAYTHEVDEKEEEQNKKPEELLTTVHAPVSHVAGQTHQPTADHYFHHLCVCRAMVIP